MKQSSLALFGLRAFAACRQEPTPNISITVPDPTSWDAQAQIPCGATDARTDRCDIIGFRNRAGKTVLAIMRSWVSGVRVLEQDVTTHQWKTDRGQLDWRQSTDGTFYFRIDDAEFYEVDEVIVAGDGG